MNEAVVDFINRTFASRAAKGRYGMKEMRLVSFEEQQNLGYDTLYRARIDDVLMDVIEYRIGIARFKGYLNMVQPATLGVFGGERRGQEGMDIILTSKPHNKPGRQVKDKAGLSIIDGYAGDMLQLHSVYESDMQDLAGLSMNTYVELECVLVIRRGVGVESIDASHPLYNHEMDPSIPQVINSETFNFDPQVDRIYRSLDLPRPTTTDEELSKEHLGLSKDPTPCYTGRIYEVHVGGMTKTADKEWQGKIAEFRYREDENRKFQQCGLEFLYQLAA